MGVAADFADRILELRRVPAGELRGNAKNWRKHPKRQRRLMEGVLREVGWAGALIAYEEAGELVLIDGHLRLDLAGEEVLPVLVLDVNGEEAEKVLATFDWIGGLAGADSAVFERLLGGLELGDDDLRAAVGEMMRHNDGSEEDDKGEVAEEKLGGLWDCGGHRVFCGDSTDPGAVDLLFGGESPVLMVTDPPYGVEYAARWRDEVRSAKTRLGSAKTRLVGEVLNDDVCDWGAAFDLYRGSVAYVWHAGVYAGAVAASLERGGLEIRSQIVWVKQGIVMSRGCYHWQHEPCYFAARGALDWIGGRKNSTVWEIKNLNGVGGGGVGEGDMITGHGTQKPVECMARPMRNHGGPGAIVYDPFLGSGTSLIAAEQEGRVCYGMELSPVYVGQAVRRWENFTGRKAVQLEV